MSFISGAYTATYDTSALGITAVDSIKINHQVFKQLITGDNFAETPQDAVFRGMAVFLDFTLNEYNATGARKAFWPYGTAWGTMSSVIGTTDQATNAKQLILTAVAGTPAAAAPATITFPKAILAENYPVDILMGPRLREIPVRMRIYPNSSGEFFTLT